MEGPYPSNVEALPEGSSQLSVAQFHVDAPPWNPSLGPVYFYVIFMKDSLMVWMGAGTVLDMDNIALCMREGGVCADVLGSNDVSRRVATRLQKKYGQVAYVSYNVSDGAGVAQVDEMIPAYCEKELFARLDKVLLKKK